MDRANIEVKITTISQPFLNQDPTESTVKVERENIGVGGDYDNIIIEVLRTCTNALKTDGYGDSIILGGLKDMVEEVEDDMRRTAEAVSKLED